MTHVYDDLRILDLTMGWAGPLATMLFADFGAEVIKVEGPSRIDWWRYGSASKPKVDPSAGGLPESWWEQSPLYNAVNRNKQDVVVDLAAPEGRAIIERLVPLCDVVVESFSPRVLRNWGLTYDRLRELNPRIVLLSLPAVGLEGPWAHYVGYASTTEAIAGLPALCGYDGGGPILQSSFLADPLGGLNGAVALAMALLERDETGEGQHVEVSQVEGMTPLIGEALIEAQLSGAPPVRSGSGDPGNAPYGCFPAEGDDRWVAVCVSSDDDWQRLCSVIDRPDLAGGPALATRDGRLVGRDRVDEAVAAWTRARPAREAMELLQQAGVTAAAVNDAAQLLDDPQLEANGTFVRVDRAVIGPHPYPGVLPRLSLTPGEIQSPSPLFGEHNDAVLRGLLELTDDELAALRAGGTVADSPQF
jgi:crotonobetainyl-CoA:carnitine CoA-transferase CaiB-like acyl-CoA transferase